MSRPIQVTSHVGRDFLQNAAYFGTLPRALWEYVSNSLDNPGENPSVRVAVSISRERIVVEDDGAGMSREDLRRFFQMHGENAQRQRGKQVRGRFGTGKSAAFGIASRLRIETIRDGLLNVVELDRRDLQKSRGSAIPVRDITVDAWTPAPNGTRVIISGLSVRQLDIRGAVSYLERHLGRRNQRHTVTVNGHVCALVEPVAVREREFRPPPEVAARLGEVVAIVKLSPSPLEAENAGIDIFSYGNWHDTTLAGLPADERTRRVFGEVEVPALEEYEGPFPPFDNTRNNTLSLQNPLVGALLSWLASCITALLREVDEAERERRRSSEAKALRAEASRIQRVLNEDLRWLQVEVAKARGAAGAHGSGYDVPGVGVGELDPRSPHVLPDTDGAEPTALVVEPVLREPDWDDARDAADAPREGDGEPRRLEPVGGELVPGLGFGSPRELVERPRRSSGFALEYGYETESAHRSRYDEETKTIHINLDHPQLEAARALGGLLSPAFRQVSYELAFVEYAMALTRERAGRGSSLSGEEALYEMRDTLDRVTRRVRGVL